MIHRPLTPAHVQQADAAITQALSAWHATLLGIGEYAVPICMVLAPLLFLPAARRLTYDMKRGRRLALAGIVIGPGVLTGLMTTALVGVIAGNPHVFSSCRSAAAMLRSQPEPRTTTTDIAAALRLQRRVDRICGH